MAVKQNMTYHQQRQDYEEAFFKKRLEEITPKNWRRFKPRLITNVTPPPTKPYKPSVSVTGVTGVRSGLENECKIYRNSCDE